MNSSREPVWMDVGLKRVTTVARISQLQAAEGGAADEVFGGLCSGSP